MPRPPAGFLAVIQAIVSVVADLGDGVRALSTGPLRIVLLQRGHLYLAAASTRGEPDAALRQQLHLLHQHLLLLVTGGAPRWSINTHDAASAPCRQSLGPAPIVSGCAQSLLAAQLTLQPAPCPRTRH